MKKVQENNILDKLPLGIMKLFMSRDEKEKLRTSQELEQWAKSNNMSPERAKAMAAVLAKVDPDTGRIPTGVNTGNVDESKFDDIKASPNKFTNWEYKDPKNLSLARRIVSKGRNANEAALYVAMRYPEYPDLNPQYLKDTGVVVSVIDKFVEAIYDGKTEAPERGETPYFMKETKNKTKMNKKDLMKMIREVIAEEMGSSATDVGNYEVTLNSKSGYTPLKFKVSKDRAEALEGIQTGTFLNKEFNTSTFDVEKKYNVSTMTQTKEDGTIIRTLRILDIGDGTIKDRIKENKMKVNQLRQIIREEISKVLMEADMSGYTAVSTTDSGGTKTYKDSGMDKVAQALADAMNDQSSEESFFNKFKKDGTVKNVPMEVFNAVISNNMESLSPEFKKWIKYNISDIDEPIEYIEVSTTNGSDVVGLRTSYHLGAAQSNKDAGFNLKWPHRGLDPMSSD